MKVSERKLPMKKRFTATVRIETVHVEHVRRWVDAESAEAARSELLGGRFEEEAIDSHTNDSDAESEITSQVEECK
tara:strand:- start:1502 stop:1729 length:228 start_codon:yes stop_codon:yes gene_type:complete